MVAFHYAHTDAAQSMLHFDFMLQKDQHQLEAEKPTLAASSSQANGGDPDRSNAHAANQSRTADGQQAVGRETANGSGEADNSAVDHETMVLNDILEAEFEPAKAEGFTESPAQMEKRAQPPASRSLGHDTAGGNKPASGVKAVARGRTANGQRANGTAVRPHDTADSAKAKIIQEVIQESKDQLRLVEQHLRALRVAYPEVMASIRTRQVAQEMLLVKEEYVHELKASGLFPVPYLMQLPSKHLLLKGAVPLWIWHRHSWAGGCMHNWILLGTVGIAFWGFD